MRRLTSTVAAVVGVTLLAGCGGNPEAGTAPTPSPSDSPSESMESEPSEVPAVPDAVSRKGRPGADAFVRYYVSLINFATQSGRTDALVGASAPDCIKCTDLANGIDDIYESGGTVEGGGWSVTSTRHYGLTEGRYFVDVIIDSAPQTLTRADGTREEFRGARDRLRAFVLERTEESWRVSEIDPIA